MAVALSVRWGWLTLCLTLLFACTQSIPDEAIFAVGVQDGGSGGAQDVHAGMTDTCVSEEQGQRTCGECSNPAFTGADCDTCKDYGSVNDCTCQTVGTGCRRRGSCTAKAGACVAVRASDCTGAEDCGAYGHCSLSGGSCVALTDADCSESAVCQKTGKCKATNGKCEKAPISDSCKNRCGVFDADAPCQCTADCSIGFLDNKCCDDIKEYCQ